MKSIKVILSLVMLFLLTMTGIVTAGNLDFEPLDVYIDGVHIDQKDVIQVERGETISVAVKLESSATSQEDVKVKAWIGGYEYGDIEDVTEMFDVEEGIIYTKYLTLNIPEDLEVGGHAYTLHIEIYNDNYQYKEEYTLYVEAARHELSIQDVILSPSETVEAGQTITAQVRVENTGENKEEDIKVEVQIADLGVSDRVYIDELTNEEIENEDEESSLSSDSLYLTIPKDAPEGEYEVTVEVTYNNGYSVISTTEIIFVENDGVSSEESNDETSVAAIQANVDEFQVGKESSFKVLIGNFGDSSKIYTIEITGTDYWAKTNIEQSLITVAAGSTGEVVYTINPEDVGSHQYSVIVKCGDAIVEEQSFNVEVADENSLNNYAIACGVLAALIILIILGLVIKRMLCNCDEDEFDFEQA